MNRTDGNILRKFQVSRFGLTFGIFSSLFPAKLGSFLTKIRFPRIADFFLEGLESAQVKKAMENQARLHDGRSVAALAALGWLGLPARLGLLRAGSPEEESLTIPFRSLPYLETLLNL